MPSGNSHASTSTITSKSKAITTQCPTRWSSSSLRSASVPRSWKSSTKANGWPATSVPSSKAITVRSRRTCRKPTGIMRLGRHSGCSGGRPRAAALPRRSWKPFSPPGPIRNKGFGPVWVPWGSEKAMVPSASTPLAAGRSRSGPVNIRVLNRSSKTALIAVLCLSSPRPRPPLATPISVVPSTTKKTEENPDAAPSDLGQTPEPAPARDVSRTRGADADARDRPTHLRRAPRAPSRPRIHGARGAPVDHPLTPSQTPAGGLSRRPRLSPAPRAGEVPHDDAGDVPVDSGPSQRADHGANRDWQNLDRLRSGPEGLPRRLYGPLPPPAPAPAGVAHCQGGWALWEADGHLGEDRCADPR